MMTLPMDLNEQQKAELAAWLSDPKTPAHFKRAAEAHQRLAEKINAMARLAKNSDIGL